MKVNLRLAGCASFTGRLLSEALTNLDIDLVNQDRADAILCYGLGIEERTTKPVLNERAGHLNKYEEQEALRFHGVPAPITTRSLALARQAIEQGKKVLARQSRHRDAQDITFCSTLRELDAARADFYSVFMPSVAEWRVGIFKGDRLCVYYKHRNEERTLRTGEFSRPYSAGWRYETAETYNPRIISIARDAVAAVKYDFGAVDILEGIDGTFRALEVNSAPGVAGPRSQWLVSLVRCVSTWLESV